MERRPTWNRRVVIAFRSAIDINFDQDGTNSGARSVRRQNGRTSHEEFNRTRPSGARCEASARNETLVSSLTQANFSSERLINEPDYAKQIDIAGPFRPALSRRCICEDDADFSSREYLLRYLPTIKHVDLRIFPRGKRDFADFPSIFNKFCVLRSVAILISVAIQMGFHIK